MPIYSYECLICGHKLDELQKIDDPPLLTCPLCSRDKLIRRPTAGVFDLKGNGFYRGGMN